MPTYPNTDHNQGLSKTAEMHEEIMSSILAPKIAAAPGTVPTEKVAAAPAQMSVEDAINKVASTPEGVAALQAAYADGVKLAEEKVAELSEKIGEGPDDEDEDEE